MDSMAVVLYWLWEYGDSVTGNVNNQLTEIVEIIT